MLVVVVKAVPGVEDETAGAVFAVFAEFAFFEDAEGLRGRGCSEARRLKFCPRYWL